MEYRQALQTLSTQYQNLLQVEQSTRYALVEKYSACLTALAARYKNARVPEPLLTIPRVFGRTHDEYFISDYLAYILDPAKNGLETAPLEAFLRLCQIDIMNIPLEHAHIRREYGLEGGRIDLLIECGEYFVVGVENKIYSPEGVGQTIHYSRVMDKNFSDIPHHLVFLTRTGYHAASKNAIPISYTMLWEALRSVPVSNLQDRRKLVMWEDFLEHLEVYIMNKNSTSNLFTFSEKAQLYFDNYEMITDLTEIYKQEWGDAIAFLETSLNSRLGEGWETDFPTRYGYQLLYKPQWRPNNIFIHFEWWFTFDAYQNRHIKTMVDVEGKRSVEALAFFDLQYKKLDKTYAQLGIEYRPKKRKNAIAFKEYFIEQDINKVAEKFYESFEELGFLEPVIDEVLADVLKKV
jgi:hypothetical protein